MRNNSVSKKFDFPGILLICSLIIISALAYGNSLKNEFVWDDLNLIQDNFAIRDLRNIFSAFTSGLFPRVSRQENFYRPLHAVSLMLDYSIWKLNPMGYHITNILIHLLNSILIYFLILNISSARITALIASLLFVCHPIHTEAVTYISGRSDLLVTLFFLLSLLSFIKYSENDKKIFYISALISFFAALMSKEIAIIFPFLIILYDACFLRQKKSFKDRFLKDFFSFFCLSAAYLLIYKLIIGQAALRSVLISRLNLFERMTTFIYIIVSYLALLLLPINLHMERIFSPITNPLDIRFLISSLNMVIIIGLIFKKNNASKLIYFGSTWFFLNLLPTSNIFIPLNALMAEHWLYLPSVGFFTLFGIWLARLFQLKQMKYIATALVIAIISFYSVLTIKQNRTWKDEITLYRYTLRFSPKRPRLHNNLGKAYFEKKMYQESISEFNKAITLNPDYAQAHINLGNVYQEIGRYDEAIQEYKKAISKKDTSSSAYNNLGNTYLKQQQYAQAIATYKSAIEMDSNDYEIWSNLGNAYLKIKDFSNAIEAYNRSIKLNPLLFNAYNNLGAIFLIQGKIKEAIDKYKEALKLNPLSSEAYFNLGLAYNKQGKLGLVETNWEKAIRINPDLTAAKEGLKKLRESGY